VKRSQHALHLHRCLRHGDFEDDDDDDDETWHQVCGAGRHVRLCVLQHHHYKLPALTVAAAAAATATITTITMTTATTAMH